MHVASLAGDQATSRGLGQQRVVEHSAVGVVTATEQSQPTQRPHSVRQIVRCQSRDRADDRCREGAIGHAEGPHNTPGGGGQPAQARVEQVREGVGQAVLGQVGGEVRREQRMPAAPREDGLDVGLRAEPGELGRGLSAG